MKTAANSPAIELTALVSEAAAFVYNTYKQKLPESVLFHTYQHTVDVASAADKIGKKSNLSEHSQTLITLSAWFHDVGYVESYEEHVEASARIAAAFLESRRLPREEIQDVVALIRYVHTGENPRTPEEAALHDANLAFAGGKQFFDRSARLRMEWERTLDCTFSDREWAERQLAFLTSLRFFSPYGKKKYERRRHKNLRAVHDALAVHLGPDELREQAIVKKEVPERGIETMFRNLARNHIDLSSIADSKANIMISVNAILLSIIISFVSTRLQTDAWLLIPSASLTITCLVAIVFAILSARPKVTNKSFSLDEVRRSSAANILFFGNFTNMPLHEFTVGVRELMQDSDLLYDNMISDIYSLGQVLQKKYRLLWISYSAFMAGVIVSVVLFAIFAYLSP
jgi:predicted metal-dependent HD superfamily phosphohydrolase